MAESIGLLDTPKKNSLQSQADTIRCVLKEYERAFGAEHGRKPSRDEIKSNKAIAAQYQQYQTIRDVLAGKRGLEVLNPPKRTLKKRHERTDSAISLTPRRSRKGQTPQKPRTHPSDIDPYDPPSSISPRVFPNAIGPTPRRDGMVLGIFDLLSNSGSRHSSQVTPSCRKRKIDVFYGTETQNGAPSAVIAQTPSQKRRQSTNLETNTISVATPRSSLATGKRNQSKTPVSESKKFMLNHFFATPSAVRFAGVINDKDDATSGVQTKTPLRDLVLGISPAKNQRAGHESSAQVDATPPYLKRSFSFKERLLSAFEDPVSSSAKPTTRRGLSGSSLSGSLRQGRFAPKPLSQIISDREQAEEHEQQQQQQMQLQRAEDDGEEDDLDALREMEATEVNVLVEDSQLIDDLAAETNDPQPDQEQPARVWKKKGQKRTTRRVVIRPVQIKPAAPSKGKRTSNAEEKEIDDDEDATEDDNNISRVEDTQFIDPLDSLDTEPLDPDLDFLDNHPKPKSHPVSDEDDDDFQPPSSPDKTRTSKPKPKSSTKQTKSKNTTIKPADEDADTGGRKINPNAYSHMNFRSLKIKNKNSKAKGRGRFGKGRR